MFVVVVAFERKRNKNACSFLKHFELYMCESRPTGEYLVANKAELITDRMKFS